LPEDERPALASDHKVFCDAFEADKTAGIYPPKETSAKKGKYFPK
jgi:hypothetical protein